MKLPDTKKSSLVGTLILGALGLLLGVLLIALNTDFLLKIVFVVLGVITVLYSLPGLAVGFSGMDTGAGRASLVMSLISLAVGFLMIFWHSTALMIVLGAYLLVFPLIQIFLTKDKITQLKAELPKMILGIVLLFIGPAKALSVAFDVAGWIIIVLSIAYLIFSLISFVKTQTQKEATTGNRIFVDTTGDGKVDTVYVDTTGDGKPDTAKRYRDKK